MTPPADGWPQVQAPHGGAYPPPGSAYPPPGQSYEAPGQQVPTSWGTPLVEASTDQLERPLEPAEAVATSEPAAGVGPAGPAAEVAPPAHRSNDRSLVFTGVAKSAAAALIAVAVIISGIVAINALQSDDNEKTPTALTGTSAAARSGSSSAAASRGAAVKPQTGKAATSAAVKPGAKSAAKPAPKPAAKPAPKPVAKPAATGAAAEPAPAASAAEPAPALAVRVPLTILNSSRIKGLATSAARDFRAAGWQVPESNIDNTRLRVGVTTVYYPPGQEAAARRLMREVPAVQQMRARPSGLTGTGLTVVVTREYDD